MNNVAGLIENFFVRNRERFGYIHMGMFVVFMALIFIPPFLSLPAEDDAIWNNFTLISRFLIWGLWFPLVLLSVILFGRLWCGLLCPQGALSEYAGRKGLNRPMEVVGGTMVLAAIVGFVYASGRRPWCRYLCPIGPLLGIFSRLGAVSFEKNGGNGKGCVCPTFINTTNKVASSNCIECFRCVNPETSSSLHLNIRRPGLEIEEIKTREPNILEVFFLFLATGLALGAFYWQVNPIYIQYKQAIGSFLLNYGLGDFIGKSGPWWIMVNYQEAGEVFNWLDFTSITSFMLLSMISITVVLFLLTLLSAFMLRGKEEVMTKVVRLGYLYTPVALISLVLGLGLILFQSLVSLSLNKETVHTIQWALFTGGGIWSLYLAARFHGLFSPAMIPNILGIGLVAAAWNMALF